MSHDRLRVLVAEDNEGDVYFIREALRRVWPECEVYVVEDGDEALKFLMHQPPLENEPTPDVIVLDVNLPRRDGGEVLEAIRGNQLLQGIPVAVVSSSPRDILRRAIPRADCYITKPSSLDEFLAIGEQIQECWRQVRNARMAAAGAQKQTTLAS